MASRFDGPRVLAAIGDNPNAFPALKADIDATARKLLTKQLKAASLNNDTFRTMFSTVGENGIRVGFDGMSGKDLTAIVRRLDPANQAIIDADDADLQDHICRLGRGDVAPAVGKKVTARSPAKKTGKTLSKIGEVLNSKVHSGLPTEPPKKASARSRAAKT